MPESDARSLEEGAGKRCSECAPSPPLIGPHTLGLPRPPAYQPRPPPLPLPLLPPPQVPRSARLRPDRPRRACRRSAFDVDLVIVGKSFPLVLIATDVLFIHQPDVHTKGRQLTVVGSWVVGWRVGGSVGVGGVGWGRRE